MFRILILSVLSGLLACQENNKETKLDAAESAPKASATAKEIKPAAASLAGPVIATLDMGAYLFRVHEIIQYHPGDMQARMMKLDDAGKDFYILDCSIENRTDSVIDVGRNTLAAYFKLSNGELLGNVLRGAAILGSYNTDNKKKYPQSEYDLLWSSKFPPRSSARTHLYAVEIPEGVTITGIGFYAKSKTKNRFTEFK